MEAEEVENVLYSDDSSVEQRWDAVVSWWKTESVMVQQGTQPCIENCLICHLLDCHDASLALQQLKEYVLVIARRGDDALRAWAPCILDLKQTLPFPEPPTQRPGVSHQQYPQM